jgi:hypothetical protein
MSKIISKYNDWELNEAKNSPYKVNDYVSITGEVLTDKFSFQIFQSTWTKMFVSDSQYARPSAYPSRYNRSDFTMKSDFVDSFGDEPLFYVKLEKIGVKWADGKIVFANSKMNMPTLSGFGFRFDMKAWPETYFKPGRGHLAGGKSAAGGRDSNQHRQ